MPLKPDAALRKDQTSAYSAMEHRHFATIAAIIASMPAVDSRDEVIAHFSRELARTNPKFNAIRFTVACDA